VQLASNAQEPIMIAMLDPKTPTELEVRCGLEKLITARSSV
jgi:hypothetical protein